MYGYTNGEIARHKKEDEKHAELVTAINRLAEAIEKITPSVQSLGDKAHSTDT